MPASLRLGLCGVLDEVGDGLAGAGAELEQGTELRAGDAGVADQGEQFDLLAEQASLLLVVVAEEEGWWHAEGAG
jgi:hypothetical protein